MTLIKLNYNKESLITKVDSKGHTGYARAGEDIVCSAITILLRTFAKLAYESQEVNFLSDLTEVGSLKFTINIKKDSSKKMYKGYCKFLEKGLLDLMEAYKEFLCLEKIKTG